MLFRRNSSTAPALPTPRPRSETPIGTVGTDALDALVRILRAYGRLAIDTERHTAERTQATVDHWVRHAAHGHPLPGGGDRAGQRNWRALTEAFVEHRRQEVQALGGTITQLRETVWAFVGSLHGAARDEGLEDDRAARQMSRMRQALATGSREELAQVAGETLTLLDDMLASRRSRQQQQFAALGERLRQLSDQLEEARHAGTLDPLTGLANRKELDAFLQRIVQLHGFVARPACLLMVDVDGFKQWNDSFGHQAGDDALKQLAGCFARTFLRRCDFVCRYGGDEFAVVMRDTPMASALTHAERLRAAARDITLPGIASHEPLSLSVGIAEVFGDESLEDWLRRADRALYRAKHEGRDRVVQAES